jgi:magnesium transporter
MRTAAASATSSRRRSATTLRPAACLGGAEGRDRGRARRHAEEFDLHPLAVEDRRHGHQRPKIEEYGDSLFAVLNTVEVKGDELNVGEVDIFVGPNYVLSVRTRTERGFQDVRSRAEREPQLLKHGSGYVLYFIMDAVVDRYFPVLDAIETELEALEDRIFTGSSPRRTSSRCTT